MASNGNNDMKFKVELKTDPLFINLEKTQQVEILNKDFCIRDDFRNKYFYKYRIFWVGLLHLKTLIFTRMSYEIEYPDKFNDTTILYCNVLETPDSVKKLAFIREYIDDRLSITLDMDRFEYDVKRLLDKLFKIEKENTL